jgi:hypothetical protein
MMTPVRKCHGRGSFNESRQAFLPHMGAPPRAIRDGAVVAGARYGVMVNELLVEPPNGLGVVRVAVRV